MWYSLLLIRVLVILVRHIVLLLRWSLVYSVTWIVIWDLQRIILLVSLAMVWWLMIVLCSPTMAPSIVHTSLSMSIVALGHHSHRLGRRRRLHHHLRMLHIIQMLLLLIHLPHWVRRIRNFEILLIWLWATTILGTLFTWRRFFTMITFLRFHS